MAGGHDDAVVGAGIVGLAHAHALARRGRRVVVVERFPRAEGASLRNFGMIWPIGQPLGERADLARRSREHWLAVLRDAGLWHEAAGSLHLAHREDEAAVLEEFAREARAAGVAVELWDAARVASRVPRVETRGLRAALFSPSEVCVDPREVVPGLAAWLEKAYGVELRFGVAAAAWEPGAAGAPGRLVTGAGALAARRLWCCPGDAPGGLLGVDPAALGLARVKLQMLRAAAPAGAPRLGALLAGGLTLRHYEAFAACPSLPALRERVARESPAYDRLGIHVMVSQPRDGTLVIGDSHEDADAAGPFAQAAVETPILEYLPTFLRCDGLRVEARWSGTYARHPRAPWVVTRPADDVCAVTGLGGAGMTLSFGLAERVVAEVLDRDGAPS